MEVANIKYNHSWCLQDFNNYWAQVTLQAGSYQTSVDPVQAITDHIVGLVQELNEVMYWRGNTTLVDPNRNKFNGFLRIIDVAAASVNGNPTAITTATGITSSNADTILAGMIALAPGAIIGKEDLSFKVGYDTFLTILEAFYANNSFGNAINPAEARMTGSLIHPLYMVRIEAFHGLTGTNRIILSRNSNHYIGTDVFGEENNFDLFHSRDNDETRLIVRYKAGVQVAFPAEIVQFTLV
jgi:hypothetical protein